MDIQTIKKPVNQFDSLIIVGSRNEGTEQKNSDIDIIVVSNDFKLMRSDMRLKILDSASSNISPEIQAWGLTKDEFDSAGELSTVGYARTKGYKFI